MRWFSANLDVLLVQKLLLHLTPNIPHARNLVQYNIRVSQEESNLGQKKSLGSEIGWSALMLGWRNTSVILYCCISLIHLGSCLPQECGA